MDNELFNEAFKKYGQVVLQKTDQEGELIELTRKSFIKLFEHIKVGYPNLPNIEVNFIDGQSLSGHAMIYNGKYLIAIQKGSLNILNNVFMRMLANPLVFSKLGQSANEKEIEKIDLAQITNYERFIIRDVGTVVPKDQRRGEVAGEMIFYSMRQLFLHELAHLFRGHYSWLYIGKNVENCTPIIYQSLEVDADLFGINFVLNEMKIENEKISSAKKDILLEERLFIWTFALSTMLNLIVQPEEVKDFEGTKTPPFALRFRLMMEQAVLTVFKNHHNIDNITQTIYEGMTLSQEVFSKIQEDYPYSHLAMSSSKEVTEHRIKVQNAWLSVEKELFTYAVFNFQYR